MSGLEIYNNDLKNEVISNVLNIAPFEMQAPKILYVRFMLDFNKNSEQLTE